jgi:hypothetical protein
MAEVGMLAPSFAAEQSLSAVSMLGPGTGVWPVTGRMESPKNITATNALALHTQL